MFFKYAGTQNVLYLKDLSMAANVIDVIIRVT